MILYGSYTSPYVRHCRIALAGSGLDWEFVEADQRASAKGSPTMRVPYLVDGDHRYTDSSSILMRICELSGTGFIDSADEMELFALANTTMDAAINLFLLELDDLTPANSRYLARQSKRIDASLAALDAMPLAVKWPFNHAQLRLACFLDWALFRKRIDIAPFPELQRFVAMARTNTKFADTAPPA